MCSTTGGHARDAWLLAGGSERSADALLAQALRQTQKGAAIWRRWGLRPTWPTRRPSIATAIVPRFDPRSGRIASLDRVEGAPTYSLPIAAAVHTCRFPPGPALLAWRAFSTFAAWHDPRRAASPADEIRHAAWTWTNWFRSASDADFLFQSSEIYGGLNGFWDYGPLGVELKRNVKEAWWRDMVTGHDDLAVLPGAPEPMK